MSNRNKYLIPGIAIGLTAVVGTTLFFRSRKPKPAILPEAEPLTKEQCKKRRALISSKHVEYDLLLVFQTSNETYHGEIEIKFELGRVDALSLDFQKKGIQQLFVNRKEILSPQSLLSADQLLLPQELLNLGENIVQIKFKNTFDKNRVGLIKNEEKNIHAVLCGYLPSLLFPCFDQPDIKCTLKLRMIVPKEFKTISNEKMSSEQIITECEYLPPAQLSGYKVTEFLRTKILPVHNLAFYAGLFETIKAKRNWKAVPISFHCSPDFAKKLFRKTDNLEIVVHKTLDYFFSNLESKYPFSKLDIIFVKTPYFAIEYPGAILIEESRLEECDSFDETENLMIVCHEIVHMWFGDITTCDFWDNIFLHEAFANYVSVMIWESFWKTLSGEFQSPEEYRLLNKTRTSFLASSLKSSNAVKFEIEEMELANTVFSPVVYNKGESLLFYWHQIWKDNMNTLLKKMIKSQPWGNLSYVQFLSFLPELERPKVRTLLELKATDFVSIEKTVEANKFAVKRIESTGFVWEQLPVSVYDLVTGEHFVVNFDLGENASFEIPKVHEDFVFVFNQNATAYILWDYSPKDFDRLIFNADKICQLDMINVFMNLYNMCMLKKNDVSVLLRLFVAGYSAFETSDLKVFIRMLVRVFVKKDKNPDHLNQLYTFLFSRNQEMFALCFLTSVEEAIEFSDWLLKKPEKKESEYKKAICHFNKCNLKLTCENLTRGFKLNFEDLEFTELRNSCSEENIDNEFMSLVMYRTGNRELAYYVKILRFMKSYLNQNTRVKLALKFMADFSSVSKQVSKFHIQAILGKVIPNVSTNQFPELKQAFLKAIVGAQNQPLLLNVLRTRLDILELFNQ